MRFKPKTEQQIMDERLAPEGNYGFVVEKAEDTRSKSGNDMIKLELRVYRKDNSYFHVFDYLLEAMMFKLKHFCDATELSHKYEDGTLQARDCIGKRGYVKIIVQEDKTGQYEPKNAVKDYVTDKDNSKAAVNSAKPKGEEAPDTSDFDDSDIPF